MVRLAIDDTFGGIVTLLFGRAFIVVIAVVAALLVVLAIRQVSHVGFESWVIAAVVGVLVACAGFCCVYLRGARVRETPESAESCGAIPGVANPRLRTCPVAAPQKKW